MPMVDDDIFVQAQRQDRQALEQLLESTYGPLQRMAYGLSGREDVGRGIVRFMMKQGLARLPQWRDAEMARRWFYHHTILTVRRAAMHQPTPKQEVLLRGQQPAAYQAFIRAMRALPQQQREAFLLTHGEKLDSRQVAIAMDCSTHAVELHLQAAQDALTPLAGDSFPALVNQMTQAYQA
ncbi:MAG TPA: sigma factor-like helix-turn-helix DNA-binding protein, partial [Tepidisphaeraceae bacterium]|nr:sigma factor-like helix-turn-helix DNA-binding protein [Tepidisphaeraceae bacterium]